MRTDMDPCKNPKPSFPEQNVKNILIDVCCFLCVGKSSCGILSNYSSTRQRYYPDDDDDVEREEERFTEEAVYTSTIDPEVAKMENVLDQWTLDLKRNVLVRQIPDCLNLPISFFSLPLMH